eukprot:TRINITY_DN18258_c1_g1_i1.p1 TRINITY_DN18258_c1_g1~~TRINITY_DN18258_c1_g1_i1.p1  ORF type:complete len:557 (+),score=32.02 TRINITY_DN18258_c1_g1_i1:406-2076(+)
MWVGAHADERRSSVFQFLDRLKELSMYERHRDVITALVCNAKVIEQAFKNIKAKTKLDADGLCVASFFVCFLADPEKFTRLLADVLSNTAFYLDQTIHARVYGKVSSYPASGDVRCILPLSSILTIVDALVPALLQQQLDILCQVPRGCYCGGIPGTQCMDIAFAGQLVTERTLDSKGEGGIAQADIKRFYDSIDVLRVGSCLLQNGVHPFIVFIIVAFQVCPAIQIRRGSRVATIGVRLLGALTGSRTAGICGRIVVADAIRSSYDVWKHVAFNFAGNTIALMTWIDNLYAFGKDAQAARFILESIAVELQRKWQLTFKAGSCMCMYFQRPGDRIEHLDQDIASANEIEKADGSMWCYTRVFEILGHRICANGSIVHDFDAVVKIMMRAFWANAGAQQAKHLSGKSKWKLVSRAVEPHFRWRCSRWPMSKYYVDALNRWQRNFAIKCIKLTPSAYLNETTAAELKRTRARTAGAFCKNVGLWSDIWKNRVVQWQAHIARGHNDTTQLLHALFSWHGIPWIKSQRIQSMCEGIVGTRTRATAGFVAPRWPGLVSNC